MMRAKRDAMIQQLRKDFSAPYLIVAMGLVFQVRRERAGLDPDNFEIPNPMQQLDDFLNSASIRQLKMLREIAEGITLDGVKEIH